MMSTTTPTAIPEFEAKLLEDFLSQSEPRVRAEMLRRLGSEAMRRGFYDAWARSKDKLDLDDMIGLPQPWREVALAHVTGNAKQGIRGVSGSFVIGPTELGEAKIAREPGYAEGIPVERGTLHSQRQWECVSEPTLMQPAAAMGALLQYGRYAEHEHQRGLLRQMSLKEMAAWHAAKEEAASKKGSGKK